VVAIEFSSLRFHRPFPAEGSFVGDNAIHIATVNLESCEEGSQIEKRTLFQGETFPTLLVQNG
jgi:hypothetical protein